MKKNNLVGKKQRFLWTNHDSCKKIVLIIDNHWYSTKIIENHWWSLKIIDHHWWSLKIIDHHWKSLKIVENLWESSKIIENRRKPSKTGENHRTPSKTTENQNFPNRPKWFRMVKNAWKTCFRWLFEICRPKVAKKSGSEIRMGASAVRGIRVWDGLGWF